MNPLARRRAKPAPTAIDADEVRRLVALNLSIAKRKADLEQEQAVNTALTELANDLGFDVAIIVEPDR